MDHRRRYTPTSLMSDLFIGVHYEDNESSLQWDAGMDYERKWVEAAGAWRSVFFYLTEI